MKVNDILVKAKGAANMVGFGIKKRSPEIFAAAGAIGMVATVVSACKATTKLSDILEESKDQLDQIHDFMETEHDTDVEYTEQDAKKDLTIVYIQTGVKIARLYAPSLILGVTSLTSLLASNNILKKRNAALTAAYAALNKGFDEYRSRVVEKFGEEIDHQIRYNIKPQEVEEEITNEKGKTKTIKKTVEVADPNAESDYLKYFTRSNPYWENDSDYVEMFLRAQQNYANDKLHVYKHLTLNEVYNMLGFPDTKAGMVVGWVYDPENPVGDNYVEFDVKKVLLPNENGEYEEAYAIDFNVDGNIYDKMP